jgi:hypothetical protein
MTRSLDPRGRHDPLDSSPDRLLRSLRSLRRHALGLWWFGQRTTGRPCLDRRQHHGKRWSGANSGGVAGAGGTSASGGLSENGGHGTGGTPSSGGVGGSATGGSQAPGVDAAVLDAQQVDAPAVDTKVAPPDASPDSILDSPPAGIDAVRACKNTSSMQPNMGCRSVAECGPTGPVKCCTGGPCWPASACPLPPSMCPSASGRFAVYDEPRLQSRRHLCEHGVGMSAMRVFGAVSTRHRLARKVPTAVAPTWPMPARWRLCADFVHGWLRLRCLASRCNVGGPRADGHGCELIPCNDGWACGENARCTAPADAASHGCTAMTCKSDGDCDCGYCVNGTCADNLGTCSFAPV